MSRRRFITAACLAFAGAAGLAAALVVAGAGGAGWEVLIPSAAAAAGLAALPVWALLTRRKAAPRVVHGCLAGAVVGLVAHPPMWLLALLYTSIAGSRSMLGEPVLAPGEAVAGAGLYSLFSIALTGWITVPVGGLVGGALAYAQRRLLGRTAPAAV